MSRYAVVLPDGNARPLIGQVYSDRGALNGSHERGTLSVSKVKNSRAVPNRNNQKVGQASLLTCDEYRDDVVSLNYCVRSIASQIRAKRTGIVPRHFNCVRHKSPSAAGQIGSRQANLPATVVLDYQLSRTGPVPGSCRQSLHFHPAGRVLGSGCGPGRRRTCRTGTEAAEPRDVDCGEPGGHGLDPPPVDAHVHGGGVDPETDTLADPGSCPAELLRPDRHVPRGRHDPVDLDRIRALAKLRQGAGGPTRLLPRSSAECFFLAGLTP